jgi:hypothetical protein
VLIIPNLSCHRAPLRAPVRAARSYMVARRTTAEAVSPSTCACRSIAARSCGGQRKETMAGVSVMCKTSFYAVRQVNTQGGLGRRIPHGKRLNRPNYPKIESAKPHKRAHSDYSGLPGIWAPPKMKPPQRVSQGGYHGLRKLGLRRAPQSLDSLRDDDCPQRKRADCECYGDQRCCRIDALPHNRGCDCCRVLLLTR